ncbi:hypothetical protein THASP1DRAFT_21607 [Thamnocephalis sphaerospora]|uniref:Uncharacterized protein n=1 Tax=Thamnocephalis sphaerospora TaxID=78915 RepID=A0A4P9XWQ3_9FUNG|nr:hypothetical protein THASP1DRAFT_21607 [Thamnocephalis sphaerospora]|eukprot:RKP10736.1 hypothetical protein THASP1DRAFT_21607 [Thamnocephalis sphaerospora]
MGLVARPVRLIAPLAASPCHKASSRVPTEQEGGLPWHRGFMITGTGGRTACAASEPGGGPSSRTGRLVVTPGMTAALVITRGRFKVENARLLSEPTSALLAIRRRRISLPWHTGTASGPTDTTQRMGGSSKRHDEHSVRRAFTARRSRSYDD